MAAAAKAAPKLVVRTFNKINAAGLSRFDPSMFQIKEDNNDGAHAILLRSVWKSNLGCPTPSTRRRSNDCVCSMASSFYAIDATLSP